MVPKEARTKERRNNKYDTSTHPRIPGITQAGVPICLHMLELFNTEV